MAGSSSAGRNGKQYWDKQELAYGLGTTGQTITVGGFKGFLLSATPSSEGDTKTYKDSSGATCALVVSEVWTNASLEILLIKDGSTNNLPAKGEEISGLPSVIKTAKGDDTGKWRVETLSVAWSNEDVAKVSISARHYPF